MQNTNFIVIQKQKKNQKFLGPVILNDEASLQHFAKCGGLSCIPQENMVLTSFTF